MVIIIAAVINAAGREEGEHGGGEVGKCAVTVNCDYAEEQMRL